MQLDQLAARLRPRSSFEASDLGLAMLRHFAAPTLTTWFAITLPVHVALVITLPPGWAMLVAWWLRPLFDVLVLTVLSRALFGSVPRTGDVLAALPAALPTLLDRLTWKRLDPLRAYLLPAELLEGLSGPTRTTRLRFLRSKAGGELSLILIASLIEMAVWWGLSMLVLMLAPERLLEWRDVPLLDETVYLPSAPWLIYGLFAVQYLATSVIEPTFVAAGFGQYLSRRTQTEAWDLELGLRQMAERIGKLRTPAVVLTLLALLAPRATAQTPPPAHDPATVIGKVLEEPEFDTTRARRRKLTSTGGHLDTLGALGDLGLAITVLGGLGLLAYLAARRARTSQPSEPTPTMTRPRRIAGVDLARESLPKDIAGAAAALCAQGNQRAGLGLLYRAALVQLVDGWQLAIRESATEGECLRAAAPLPDAARGYFAALTRAFVQVAYGHDEPSAQDCAALCTRWPELRPAATGAP